MGAMALAYGDGGYGYGPYGLDDFTDEMPGPFPPGLHPLTVRLYQRLGPAVHVGDAAAGWPILALCDALATPGKQLDDLVRDTDSAAGWQMSIDPDTTPIPDWAAQWYGIARIPGESDELLRARMRDRPNWRRGRPASIKAAVAATLTGDRNVLLDERAGGDAYTYTVHTLAFETPNPDLTATVVQSSKPAGLLATLVVSDAPTYADTRAVLGADTYTSRLATFPTYADASGYTP